MRPRRARQVIYPVAALVLAALVGGALLLPGEGFGAWGTASRAALVVVGLAIAYFLHRLASVRVEVDDDGLDVVNLAQRVRLSWPQVVRVRLGRDDPWVILDLADGETLPVMGIQKTDGEYAEAQARDLARRVAEGSRTERDD